MCICSSPTIPAARWPRWCATTRASSAPPTNIRRCAHARSPPEALAFRHAGVHRARSRLTRIPVDAQDHLAVRVAARAADAGVASPDPALPQIAEDRRGRWRRQDAGTDDPRAREFHRVRPVRVAGAGPSGAVWAGPGLAVGLRWRIAARPGAACLRVVA